MSCATYSEPGLPMHRLQSLQVLKKTVMYKMFRNPLEIAHINDENVRN